MIRTLAFIVFGMGPIVASAAPVLAAGKTIDMGYIDSQSVMRACRAAGTVPYTFGGSYGCGTGSVSIQCDDETCVARASDLTPVAGDSLDAVMDAVRQRGARQIRPIDTRIKPANRSVR